MIVVDASLAAKWLLAERDSDDADAVLVAHRRALIAPDLIVVEVAGSLVRRANMDKSLADTMRAALAEWSALLASDAFALHRMRPDQVEQAAALAIGIGHPLKDCVYLALAIEMNCALLTCDEKFAEKARARYADIRLLSDA